MTREEEKKYDTVVEHGVATEAESNFVKSIVKLLMVSYIYDSFKQWAEEEGSDIAD